MITSLTEEQKARFPEFVEKWTQIGLSTEPLDMKRVQEAFTKAVAIRLKKLKLKPTP